MRDGICHDIRIALGGVAPTPIIALKAEGLLRGIKLSQEVIGKAALTAADEIKPITDLRSTKEYRKELSKVLVKRAINMAWERAEENLEG
jgi:carbon-monoxide dehydrogenase medium subunit